MNFYKGAEFPCPECGELHKVYDTEEKVWRHLNFFQYKCYLHFPTPRINCPHCGKHRFTPHWGRERSGFTLLFEAFVITLFRDGLPMTAIAELVGENDTRIRRIADFHIEKAYSERSFEGVTRIGIDETSSKKGHKYVTVVTDQDSGMILFATEGRDSETIKEFTEEAVRHDLQADEITEVSMDMSPAFQKGANNYLPNAQITFDRFHVMKLLNEALDKVRKDEQNENPALRKMLKNSRYVWLKNRENLTDYQYELLETLENTGLKTAEGYRLKLVFQEIYETAKSAGIAKIAFNAWCENVRTSGLEPLVKFTEKLENHLSGILRYFTSRITNGISEGLNSITGLVKRQARGYQNMRHFINTIYLVKGGLDLPILP
jgi:transposase